MTKSHPALLYRRSLVVPKPPPVVFWSLCLRLACLLGALTLGGQLRAQTVVQEFYLPLPEAQVRSAYLILATNTGTTMDAVTSIVIAEAGTHIVYDQWEDGYEIDLNSPVQTTTRIWGDGNDGNGIPPGYTHDPASFAKGEVLTLRNLVTLPRNPATLFYDGSDRVGATKAIVVSRASWATTPGTVLAGAVEVNSTIDWGLNFVSPIGQDVISPTPLTASMFEYVGLFIMAGEDGTSVTIDPDGAGGPVLPTTTLLNRGQSYVVNGGIMKGATVTSTKPIEAYLITGDIGANYESRRYSLCPREQWYNSYITPVGTANNGNAAYVFIL